MNIPSEAVSWWERREWNFQHGRKMSRNEYAAKWWKPILPPGQIAHTLAAEVTSNKHSKHRKRQTDKHIPIMIARQQNPRLRIRDKHEIWVPLNQTDRNKPKCMKAEWRLIDHLRSILKINLSNAAYRTCRVTITAPAIGRAPFPTINGGAEPNLPVSEENEWMRISDQIFYY